MWVELMHFVRLRNVTIEFPIYQGPSRSLKKALLTTSIGGRLARNAGTDRINVRALQDVTLEIKDGDRVGIIGPNGAGKTTLLKVLAGIYEPSRGRIASSGSNAAGSSLYFTLILASARRAVTGSSAAIAATASPM